MTAREDLVTALFGLVPTSHDRKRQRAHIAFVIPPNQKYETSRWPEGERVYLCGREAADLHVRSFPWKDSDTYPTCERCRSAAADLRRLLDELGRWTGSATTGDLARRQDVRPARAVKLLRLAEADGRVTSIRRGGQGHGRALWWKLTRKGRLR